MRPATFRNLIDVLDKEPSIDSQGGSGEKRGSVLSAWAEIRALTGREVYLTQGLQTQVDFQIKTRLSTAAAAKMWVLDDLGRIFEIQAILQDAMEPRFMRILATQRKEATQTTLGNLFT